jgi:hypothetical protein
VGHTPQISPARAHSSRGATEMMVLLKKKQGMKDHVLEHYGQSKKFVTPSPLTPSLREGESDQMHRRIIFLDQPTVIVLLMTVGVCNQ